MILEREYTIRQSAIGQRVCACIWSTVGVRQLRCAAMHMRFLKRKTLSLNRNTHHMIVRARQPEIYMISKWYLV